MRWLSRDPLEEEGGFNLYGFCQNNPVCNLDPYGLSNEFAKKIVAKVFWLAFAEYYFKRLMKFPISAEMLTMSAVGNVGSGEHKFSEGGQLANAIKGSSEYKRIIAQLIDKQNVSYKYYELPNKSIEFGAGDLKTAVGKAYYDMKGGICKAKNGGTRLNLRFKVFDDYDFHKWEGSERAVRGYILSVGNNMAYDSQTKGYLTVYPWSVSFDEKRKWPWR